MHTPASWTGFTANVLIPGLEMAHIQAPGWALSYIVLASSARSSCTHLSTTWTVLKFDRMTSLFGYSVSRPQPEWLP